MSLREIPWSGFLISRLLVVHQYLMVLTGQPASSPNRPAPYSRLPHALATLSPMCPIASPSLYLRFPVSSNSYWGYAARPSCCRGSGNGGVCRAGPNSNNPVVGLVLSAMAMVGFHQNNPSPFSECDTHSHRIDGTDHEANIESRRSPR